MDNYHLGTQPEERATSLEAKMYNQQYFEDFWVSTDFDIAQHSFRIASTYQIWSSVKENVLVPIR